MKEEIQALLKELLDIVHRRALNIGDSALINKLQKAIEDLE